MRPVAELQSFFPTFTKGVCQAAQMPVTKGGIRAMPPPGSNLSASEAGALSGGSDES